jgi:hypothetical protein
MIRRSNTIYPFLASHNTALESLAAREKCIFNDPQGYKGSKILAAFRNAFIVGT